MKIQTKARRQKWIHWVIGVLSVIVISSILIVEACPAKLINRNSQAIFLPTNLNYHWQEIKADAVSYLSHYIY